tara:strand:- start:1868 stop:1993 length:126 start_codon:yes stop_codon:yes gene_type:complete
MADGGGNEVLLDFAEDYERADYRLLEVSGEMLEELVKGTLW